MRRDLKRFLTVAVHAAHEAGRLQARHAGGHLTTRTKSNPTDLVTTIDRASERLIARAIRRHFPDHGFQGEERTRRHPGAPFQWIVDPLDGTTNFVHGVPFFSVSIALTYQGHLVVGLVLDPMHRELFTATKGGGAWLNGRRIHVSRTRRLLQSLLSTGFPPDFQRDPTRYLSWFTSLETRCRGVRRMGSTALCLAYVACGRHDGFYEPGLHPWDIAGGMLLIKEAGGTVTDFHNHPVQLGIGHIVASNGHLHRALLTRLSAPAQRRLAARRRGG